MEMVVLNKWNNEMRVDLKRKNTAVKQFIQNKMKFLMPFVIQILTM